MEKYAKASANGSDAPSTSRAWAVSSSRTTYTQPDRSATSASMVAAYTPPMVKKPVGLGAKRVTWAPAGRSRGGERSSQYSGSGRSGGNRESTICGLSTHEAYRHLLVAL